MKAKISGSKIKDFNFQKYSAKKLKRKIILSNKIPVSLLGPKDKVSKFSLCSALEGILIPYNQITRSTASQKATGPCLCEERETTY